MFFFTFLVEKILEKKKLGEETQYSGIEIDKMVYKLYELTPEGIAIVEEGH